MLSNRFLLSLAAASFLSTLASGNSADVTKCLNAGAYGGYTGTFSTVGVKTAPTMLLASNSHKSPDALMNPSMDAAVSGKAIYGGGIAGPTTGGSIFPHRRYGPPCCQAREWVGSGPSQPGLSTPEPGSLMLLSTGLLGIAGVVRRKLRLG